MSPKPESSFLAEVRAEAKQAGPQCSFGAWLATLPPAEQAEVADVLADASIATTTIRTVAVRRGVAKSATDRHRKKECGCFTQT